MQELYITIREKDFAKKHCHFRPFKSQEIYRPGTTISHASNLCTAVGGDQNKKFRGNASFLRKRGPRGGIKIYCYCNFHIDQKAKVFALT